MPTTEQHSAGMDCATPSECGALLAFTPAELLSVTVAVFNVCRH